MIPKFSVAKHASILAVALFLSCSKREGGGVAKFVVVESPHNKG
jgi:hypothetical protein